MSVSFRLTCVFFLLSAAVCGVLNPGNFGAVDTTRRLQVARWIRLGEPPVRADDVDFGISGRNGVRHAWYGVGQSLVLVPFDAAVSAALSSVAPRLGLDPVKQRQLAELLIAFLMQTSITFAVLLLARLVLLSFGFSSLVSTAGALALLLGTTFLYYVQCAQENNLLLLLALVGLLAIRRWQQQPRAVWPWIAGAASGFAALVRLTSLLEAVVLLAFALQSGHHARRFLKGFVPPMILALLADRWYHWLRFGELWSTYATKIDRQHLPPSAPVDFPFGYPFNDGFFGALFSPSKSVFLFDPLLLVLILSLALQWRSAGRDLRRLLGWMAALLVLYAALYATYYDWGGDVAWGDRFLTVPVHLLCLFAVPLLLAAGGFPRRHLRHLAWCLVLAALVLQAMSTTLLANLEVHQRENGFGQSVILNRAVNLAQTISGQQDELRFAGEPSRWRTFNYLPSQLSFRFPGLAVWAAAGWGLLLISLPWLGWLALRIGAQAGLGEA